MRCGWRETGHDKVQGLTSYIPISRHKVSAVPPRCSTARRYSRKSLRCQPELADQLAKAELRYKNSSRSPETSNHSNRSTKPKTKLPKASKPSSRPSNSTGISTTQKQPHSPTTTSTTNIFSNPFKTSECCGK